MSRARELRGIALLVVFGVLVGTAIAEIAARFSWTAPWYERLLDEQELQPTLYRANAQGLRDRDYGPKPPGRKRVMMLGDSFTYGLGVVDETKIFPEIVERGLNEMGRFPGGVDVLNASVPGSLTGAWLGTYRRNVEHFQPDLVLAVFFLRDGTNLALRPDFFAPLRSEVARRNRDSIAYGYSFLYRVLRDRLDRRLVADRYSRALIDAYTGNEEQTAEWRKAGLNLFRLRERVHRRGQKLAFVTFPVLVELHADYPFQEICDVLATYATEGLSVPFHDLLPAFLGRNAPDLWVSPLNQHPNARGHAIAAESLLPFVAKLLDDGPPQSRAPRSK